MDIQIALDKTLAVKPSEFVRAWNDAAETRAVAQASVAPSTTKTYDPLLDAGLLVLSSVFAGLATNTLYDLIKETLTKQGIQKRTRIIELTQPDGTRLLVITVDEKK